MHTLLHCTTTPEGFHDLAHAYTLFAPSLKRGNPEQRGQFNLSAAYQLPLGFTVAGNYFGRQGYPIAYLLVEGSTFKNADGTLGDGINRTAYATAIDAKRYGWVSQLDMRLDKNIPIITTKEASEKLKRIGFKRTYGLSTWDAVDPPTNTPAWVLRSIGGIVRSRKRETRLDVWALCGEVAGYATTAAAVPVELSRGAATEATPGVERSAVFSRLSAAESWALGSATATCRGPLKPGPNPLASRS